MPPCIVPNCHVFCTNRADSGFKLPPKNGARREAWLKLIGIDESAVPSYDSNFVCMKHFNEKAKFNIRNKIYTDLSLPSLLLHLPPSSPTRAEREAIERSERKRLKREEDQSQNDSADVGVYIKTEVDDVPSAVDDYFNNSDFMFDELEEGEIESDNAEFFIMSKAKLLQIFKLCPKCGKQIGPGVKLKILHIGTAASVSYYCTTCGKTTWCSQDQIPNRKVCEANLNLSKAVKTGGLGPKGTVKLFKEANTAMLCETQLGRTAYKYTSTDSAEPSLSPESADREELDEAF